MPITTQNNRQSLLYRLRKRLTPFLPLKQGLRRWKDRWAKRFLLCRMNLHVSLLILTVLLQTQSRILTMPRVKKMTTELTQETDQDQIAPETEQKPATKRGRPRGIGTSASSGKSKLDKEIAAIEASLCQLFALGTLAAVPLSTISDTLANDALIVADRGTTFLAPAIAALARENPRLRAALITLGENNAYAQLAVAVCAIVVPIGVNHGVIDPRVDRVFDTMAQVKNADPAVIQALMAQHNGKP